MRHHSSSRCHVATLLLLTTFALEGQAGLTVPQAALLTGVDEAALAKALADGSIFAAGLDVYEHEPRIHADLVDLPNALLLPHIASATVEDRTDLTGICVENVVSVLAGREPRFSVSAPPGT